MRKYLIVLLFFAALGSIGHAQKATTRVVLLSAVTTGTSQPAQVFIFNDLAIFLTSVNTTSGGTVTIEEADWDPMTGQIYSGTWSSIVAVNASTFTGGVTVAYHCPVGSYRYVRARVSSNITGGGTISAVLVGS